jgi:hypothetical protein
MRVILVDFEFFAGRHLAFEHRIKDGCCLSHWCDAKLGLKPLLTALVLA